MILFFFLHLLTRPQDKSVWSDYALYLYMRDRDADARRLMQRSLECLPKRDHLDMISKFAQLEFRHGSIEKGKDLYESILENYPKRSDVWLMYASMLIKYTLSPSSSHSAQQQPPRDQSQDRDQDHGDCISDVDNNGSESRQQITATKTETSLDENKKVIRDKVTADAHNPDSIESVRNVFERVVNMGLKGKKLNSILKKYQEFEERFGNESNVQRITDKMEAIAAHSQ